MDMSSQLHSLAPLHPAQEPLAPFGQKDDWVLALIWIFWRCEKFVAPGRNQPLDHTANSLVSVLTQLSQLPYFTTRVYFSNVSKILMYFKQFYKVLIMVCHTETYKVSGLSTSYNTLKSTHFLNSLSSEYQMTEKAYESDNIKYICLNSTY
jgi:hypothetical protein